MELVTEGEFKEIGRVRVKFFDKTETNRAVDNVKSIPLEAVEAFFRQAKLHDVNDFKQAQNMLDIIQELEQTEFPKPDDMSWRVGNFKGDLDFVVCRNSNTFTNFIRLPSALTEPKRRLDMWNFLNASEKKGDVRVLDKDAFVPTP
eukprot:GHVT01034983.1.p2 GENE.GHVT01034983.1~~GHVT01034983.1.p2  ORF type:complete len:146 (-),score=19.35 GHVT01034983.1:68-505(-)